MKGGHSKSNGQAIRNRNKSKNRTYSSKKEDTIASKENDENEKSEDWIKDESDDPLKEDKIGEITENGKFETLGSMLKHLKMHWLDQLKSVRDSKKDKTMNRKGLPERFSGVDKYMIVSFTLIFTFSLATRLYKISDPPHVW